MAGYRIVKYCKLCKRRMLLEKGDNRRYYCDECQARINRDMEKEKKQEKKEEKKEEKRKQEKK
ncbi:MAG: hypothetical protein R6U32_00760 [Candidatus Woesearchaeota archaeon]